MQVNINDSSLSQQVSPPLTISLEEQSQQSYFNSKRQASPRELLWKEIRRKTNNSPFPTVGKIIQLLNSQTIVTSPRQSQHQQEHMASHQHLKSLHLSHSIKSNIKKKSKDISKFLTMKKDIIERIEKTSRHYQERNIKQSIEMLVNDIYSARSDRAFFSQPHYTKHKGNNTKNLNQLKLINKVKQNSSKQTDFQYVTIPGSYKTIQSSRTFIQHQTYKKKLSSSKVKEEMNKIEAEKGYIKTIWQLGVHKKKQSQKKNLYHTIDPNKTERWVEIAQNSRKKLSYLFKNKDQMSVQNVITQSKSRKNEYVEKLLQKSSQQYRNFTNEVNEMTKVRNQGKSLILKDNDKEYKDQQKDNLRIKKNRQSSSSSKKGNIHVIISQILPQIKLSSIYQF